MARTDRDGFDIDCCRNVRVSNCTVNSPWDDAICPKSSYALGYRRPTDNVTIANNYVSGYYELGSVIAGTWKKFADDAQVPRQGRAFATNKRNLGLVDLLEIHHVATHPLTSLQVISKRATDDYAPPITAS